MNNIVNNIYNAQFSYHLTNLKARIDAWPNTRMKRELQTKLLYIERLSQLTNDDYMLMLCALKKMKLSAFEFDLCVYCLKGLTTYSLHRYRLSEESL